MPDAIQTKRCSHCKEIKPTSEFHKNRSTSDGLSGWCKSCNIATAKAYSQTKKGKEVKHRTARTYSQTEKGKEVQRRYWQTERGKKVHRQIACKQRLLYPEKVRARNAVGNAIVSGKKAKPKTFKCADCGGQAEMYHHYLGYAPENWLDVIPLCFACDRKAHKKLRKAV